MRLRAPCNRNGEPVPVLKPSALDPGRETGKIWDARWHVLPHEVAAVRSMAEMGPCSTSRYPIASVEKAEWEDCGRNAQARGRKGWRGSQWVRTA